MSNYWFRPVGGKLKHYCVDYVRGGYGLLLSVTACGKRYHEGESFHLKYNRCKKCEAAEQNAHPTLGESATSQAVSNAETLSTSDGVPPSAPARVA